MSRLLLVADESFVSRTVRAALHRTASFEVVGFVDGRQGIRLRLLDLRPDIVLIHEMRRADDTLARVRESIEHGDRIKIILLTFNMDDAWLERVFDAGVDAVVSDAIDAGALTTLLRETARMNIVHRHHRPASDETSPLTTREAEILRLAAAGYTNARIARELWITEQTVKFHLSNTYRKLGVSNRTEASRYALLPKLGAAEPLAS